MKSRFVPKALSVLVSAALILAAPGTASYQAIASEIKTPEGENLRANPLAAPNGVPTLGAIGTSLDPQASVAVPQVGGAQISVQPVASGPAPVVAPNGPAIAPIVLPAPLGSVETTPVAKPDAGAEASLGGQPLVSPEADGAAAQPKSPGQNIEALTQSDSAKVLANPKAEKSGVLSWLFDKLKGKSGTEGSAPDAASVGVSAGVPATGL